jgi:acetoin utilization protein AcuB
VLAAVKFMTRSVVALDVVTSVADALLIVNDRRVGCLPVLDEKHRVVGVLDERQLLRAVVAGVPYLVGGLIGGRMVCVDETTDIETVAAAILENDVPGAAVVAGTELVGVVTRGDALRALLRERRTRFEEYAGTGGWRVHVDDRGAVMIADRS